LDLDKSSPTHTASDNCDPIRGLGFRLVGESDRPFSLQSQAIKTFLADRLGVQGFLADKGRTTTFKYGDKNERHLCNPDAFTTGKNRNGADCERIVIHD
jgi:hypothetical protein